MSTDLRHLRRSRALTFIDLASLSGLPARLLAEAEYGMRTLSTQESQQLALVFGLPDAAAFAQHRARLNEQPASPAARPMPRPLLAAVAGLLAMSTLQQFPLSQIKLPTQIQAAVAPVADPPAQLTGQQRVRPRHTPIADMPRQPASQSTIALMPMPLSADLLQATSAVAPSTFMLTEAGPQGCPLQPDTGQVVITQEYGVGTHAPVSIWGAVDLAVDSDGDGWPNPDATIGVPVVATHSGKAYVNYDTWPAGNHVWVENIANGWSTGYAHLAEVFIDSGAQVEAGDLIGLVGSTGMSTGPHLDYQVWHNGTNVDPTELVGVPANTNVITAR